MPRFAANLSMLFTEYPFLERFDRAAASGFEAVEFLFPYAEDVPGIRAALTRTALPRCCSTCLLAISAKASAGWRTTPPSRPSFVRAWPEVWRLPLNSVAGN